MSLVENLFDEVSFVPERCDRFTIEGFPNLPTEKNLIYRAYREIYNLIPKSCREFFRYHKVVVDKRIAEGAGLGGGSSNSASFLLLLNRVCGLNIDLDRLADIGSRVGADVPFFIYGYRVANVKGFGEIVEEFRDVDFDIDIFTPNIHSDTAQVYRNFKNRFLRDIKPYSFRDWEYLNSREILSKTVQ